MKLWVVFWVIVEFVWTIVPLTIREQLVMLLWVSDTLYWKRTELEVFHVAAFAGDICVTTGGVISALTVRVLVELAPMLDELSVQFTDQL